MTAGARGAGRDADAARLEAALLEWMANAPAGFVADGATRGARYGLGPEAAAALDRDFDALALALFAFQYERVPVYHAWCDRVGRTPSVVRHAAGVPALPVDAFKRARLATFPPEDERACFHTSGTSGADTGTLHLDGLALYDLSLERGFRHHVLPDCDRMRMLALVAPPAAAPHSSLGYMVQRVMERWGAPGSALLHRDGEVRWRELGAALVAAAAAREPVCLLGTAFVWVQVLDACARDGFRVALPPGSRVFETGGYKGRSRELSRSELCTQLEATLGVPRSHVVGEYGMTEMGSQFYTLGLRRALLGEPPGDDAWSYPAWLRPRLADAETGRVVDLDAPGEATSFGLVAHHDLANRSNVAHLLCADLARRVGVSFELAGRCPRAEPRGCGLVDETRSVGA